MCSFLLVLQTSSQAQYACVAAQRVNIKTSKNSHHFAIKYIHSATLIFSFFAQQKSKRKISKLYTVQHTYTHIFIYIFILICDAVNKYHNNTIIMTFILHDIHQNLRVKIASTTHCRHHHYYYYQVAVSVYLCTPAYVLMFVSKASGGGGFGEQKNILAKKLMKSEIN